MITQKDINLLKIHFAGKDDHNELKEKVNNLEHKIDTAITLLQGNASALKSLQEEMTIKTYRADQIEEHEDRLNKIDKHLGISTAS